MRHFRFLVLCAIFAALSAAVYSFQEDDTAAQVASELGYNSGDYADYFAVSKVWPADKTKTIVAILYPNADASDENTVYFDIDILVIDTDSGKLLARNLRKKATYSDAFHLDSVEIDTANYSLAKGVRAFGIRRSYSGSSSVNPASASVMELFVVQGTKLKIVTGPMQMSQGYGEWDQNCAGQFTDITRTMGIKKTATKGYFDLEVVTSQTERASEKKGEDCVESSKVLPKKAVILKYDGKKYKVPKEILYTE